MQNWLKRVTTLSVFALLGFCAVFWVLRLYNSQAFWRDRTAIVNVALDNASTTQIDTLALQSVLSKGGRAQPAAQEPAPSAETEQLRLLGVVKQTQQTGYALIASGIAQESAKPYQIGDKVTPNWYLAQVQARSVVLKYNMFSNSDVNEHNTVTLTLPQATTQNQRLFVDSSPLPVELTTQQGMPQTPNAGFDALNANNVNKSATNNTTGNAIGRARPNLFGVPNTRAIVPPAQVPNGQMDAQPNIQPNVPVAPLNTQPNAPVAPPNPLAMP